MKKTFVIFCVVFSACNGSLNRHVEAAMHKYDNYILHVDANGIAGMFTADGELTNPNGLSIRGRDSIRAFLAQFKGFKVEEQKSTTDSIRRFGDTAIQYGKYYQRAVVNNTKAEVHGMFQANWLVQLNGELLLTRMIAWPTGNK